jgi:prepilin-type N-terminal cleavage/methylation domain-containing protein
MVKIKIRAAKGFSLIELLVVVALIGLLAALLLPALSSAMNRARSAACVNHLHEMGLAWQMYVHDNRSHYPGVAIGESRHRGERGVAKASGVFASFCGYLDGAPEYYGRPQLPKRHGQNYNQLCCDGHVDGLPPRILFNPTNTAVRWNIDHLAHPEFCPPFE